MIRKIDNRKIKHQPNTIACRPTSSGLRTWACNVFFKSKMQMTSHLPRCFKNIKKDEVLFEIPESCHWSGQKIKVHCFFPFKNSFSTFFYQHLMNLVKPNHDL